MRVSYLLRNLVTIAMSFLVSMAFVHATNYYVSTNGNDGNPGTEASPWRTLRHAVSKVPASQGHVINIAAGTYVESGSCVVPLGVSIIGAGIDKTILKAAPSFHFPEYSGGDFHYGRALINMYSLGGLNGNQQIKGFTIDGDGRKMWAGVMLRGRKNVEISYIKVVETSFFGIWLLEAENVSMHDVVMRDNAWAEGWSTGGLNMAHVTNADIYNMDMYQGRGYAIKTLGGHPSVLNNVRFHHSKVSVYPFNPWNGGQSAALAIEYWQAKLINCQIYECDIDNIISLVDYSPYDGKFAIRVHHNRLIPNPLKGYLIEVNTSDVEIDHNYFGRTPYGIAQWSAHLRRNWNVHHNIFDGFWRGTNNHPSRLFISVNRLENVNFYNNTVYINNEAPIDVFYLKPNAGASKNISFKNNLFIRKTKVNSNWPDNMLHIERGVSLSNVTITNNIFDGFPIANRNGGSNFTPGGTYNASNNLFTDANLTYSGDRKGKFFEPKAGSPAVDAGADVGFPYEGNAPDIGAVEFGGDVSNDPQTCALQNVVATPYCSGDGIFEILVTVTGSGSTYVLTDSEGYERSGIGSGSYKLGPYEEGKEIDITVYDAQNTGCRKVEADVKPTEPCSQTDPEDLTPPDPGSVFRINAGGPAYTAANGAEFEADKYFFGTSTPYSIQGAINGTQDDVLYQTERYGQAFEYKFPVENGTYKVIIHMAELYWSQENRRVFSINLEGGNPELSAYDIFKQAGGRNAVTKTYYNIDVTDGELDIAFTATKDNAKVSAIEVIKSDNTPPTFTLSTDQVILRKIAGESATMMITPDPVPENERDQTVTYTVEPENSNLANITIDPATGEIMIKATGTEAGAEVCTIRADDGQGVNNLYEQSFTLIVEEPDEIGPIAIRINAGGLEYTTQDGIVFNADDESLVTGESGTYFRGSAVANTEDDTLYLSERFGQEFGYNFDVPVGEYDVILHFAEVFWVRHDRRIFNVNIEGGAIELENLDIYKEVGRFQAYVTTFEKVKVEDGTLNIDFETIKDNAKLSAIEIVSSGYQDTRASIRINCGSQEELIFGGQTFSPDNYFAGKSMAFANPNIEEVRMTTYDELYKTERVASEDMAPFSYKIPVVNGSYVVFVHFAEIYFGATGGGPGGAGRRVFSMELEGEEVITNYDINKEVGSMGAVVQEFSVSVLDGELNLDFSAIQNRAKISAIEVLLPEDAEYAISRTTQGGNPFANLDDEREDEEVVDLIALAPNPTSGNTRLIMENGWTGAFKVRIFDATGRLIKVETKNKDYDSYKSLVELNNLRPGLYTLQVIRENYNRTLKLWIHE